MSVPFGVEHFARRAKMDTMPIATPDAAVALAADLRLAIDKAVLDYGTTQAREPGHRIKLHWPPHPVSYEFHVAAGDWTDRATFEAHGETFEVVVARTPHGAFARCEALWHETRGTDAEDAVAKLRADAEPLFARQFAAARALGRSGRFVGHVRDLPPIDVLRLLYCEDRDVANDAMVEIESHGSSGLYLPALLEVVRDRRHPMRRSAQWCALDLFEDLPSFARTQEEQAQAVAAMADLLQDAEDDYCRTVYKAGVVLGGHVAGKIGGPALLGALSAPSRIGRRAAIHGLYHVVEWSPEMRDIVVWALSGLAKDDAEPALRRYAADMARDIARSRDHVPDPTFD